MIYLFSFFLACYLVGIYFFVRSIVQDTYFEDDDLTIDDLIN
jgi:hypothetical protein